MLPSRSEPTSLEMCSSQLSKTLELKRTHRSLRSARGQLEGVAGSFSHQPSQLNPSAPPQLVEGAQAPPIPPPHTFDTINSALPTGTSLSPDFTTPTAVAALAGARASSSTSTLPSSTTANPHHILDPAINSGEQLSNTALLVTTSESHPPTAEALVSLGQARIAVQSNQPRSTAWVGLYKVLAALERAENASPPLKSAFSEVIACLDIVQTAGVDRGDYEGLPTGLEAVAEVVHRYISCLGSEDNNGSIARIARLIETEAAKIKTQQDHRAATQIIEPGYDEDAVISHYYKIETLFRQIEADMTRRSWQTTDEEFMVLLLERMLLANDARYNSRYSTNIKRRGCASGTRERVQADLKDWVRNLDGSKVCWMNGVAGTGKTTIAYSLCEWLEANQLLGASFFCSHISSSCSSLSRVVPTIAYQLAQYSPAFRTALCRILESDSNSGELSVGLQFKRLIEEPLLEVKDAIPDAVVVVIDALDECGDDYGVRLMLEVLLRQAVDLPLKILVASRPEPIIQSQMNPGAYSLSILHLHDVEQPVVEQDIKKYLKEALGAVSPPISNDEIEQLSKLAGDLFIYAATVVRFVSPDEGPPTPFTRLRTELARDVQSIRGERATRRYKQLDDLYATILAAAFDGLLSPEEKGALELVLKTVACAKEPMTTATLASLLGLAEQDVISSLQPLQSVVRLSEAGGVVLMLHATFPDYIFEHLRSGAFRWHCDRTQHNKYLAQRCFEFMKRRLKFNICNLRSSFEFDRDVPNLQQRVNQVIDPSLFYACRYWADHLRFSDASESLHRLLSDFLLWRLLFWMEVLNLKRCIGDGDQILFQAQAWLLTKRIAGPTAAHVSDARNFVTSFAASECSLSTCHLYLSGLEFLPRRSSVYENYRGRIRGAIRAGGTLVEAREQALSTWEISSPVHSVAVSPDGSRIASGSRDRAVRIWDACTGDLVVGPLQRHTDFVSSISFSVDGARIVSGSYDKTVQVWSAHTGDPVAGPFYGHTDWVSSVAFSPDCTCIVSSSYDKTIRVWDARTGERAAGPFYGHTDWVSSAIFSPDGTCIVSSSRDKTIQVWDVSTGNAAARPFKGHTDLVSSVAFSPDGSYLVSGSYDKTIRMWDARTGSPVGNPFYGHTDFVSSVAFSPDGTRIASGSRDKTVQMWDAATGDLVTSPFQEHTSFITSVAFFPDGTRIVSGSRDKTIRVWDLCARSAVTPFQGHTHLVSSVAFSVDGSRIASGSYDHTIRTWDACTGVPVAGPFHGHTDFVSSVAFSPNGTRIVSGSRDNTIRIWDAGTGNLVTGPFEGHTDFVSSVAFSPNGTLVVSGSYDNTARVWDAHTGEPIASPFHGHTDFVSSVSFSPDGTRVVSGSRDETIRMWDADTGNPIANPFCGHTGWAASVAFSPDGTRIVSGSQDKTIQVWDVSTGNAAVSPFQGHTQLVSAVAFSPDGTRIISGSHDNTIRVWDVRTGAPVASPLQGHARPVTSSAFTSDGTRIVPSANSRAIRMLDPSTSQPVTGPPQDYTPLVNGTSFSPDGLRAVSASHNASPDTDIIRIVNISSPNDPSGVLVGPWVFDPDGWVKHDDKPIFWVPPDLLGVLPRPPVVVAIHQHGSITVDYSNLLVGKNWSKCYNYW